MCVQESVYDNVVDRLKLRLAGLKCVSLQSEADRSLVDAAVQEAQQQGAVVSQETLTRHVQGRDGLINRFESI